MRHPNYPPACPAFRRVSDGYVFEGHPEDRYDTESPEHAPAWISLPDMREGVYTASEVIPLTATALIMYVLAGGTEETLNTALSHKRGRKPTARLYEEAEVYTTRADLHEAGY